MTCSLWSGRAVCAVPYWPSTGAISFGHVVVGAAAGTVSTGATTPETLAKQLAAHVADRRLDREAWLFPARTGSPLRYSYFWEVWRQAVEDADVPWLRIHDLRRWHATQLVHAGVDIRTAQRRLGHRNAATTLEIYAQHVPEADTAAAELVAARLRRPS